MQQWWLKRPTCSNVVRVTPARSHAALLSGWRFTTTTQTVALRTPDLALTLSSIPANQVGHTEGDPDATITSLAEVPAVVRRFDAS